MSGGVVMLRQMQRIDLRGDAPDGLAAAKGEPVLRFGMPEKRIMRLVEVELPLDEQGRNPVRVVFV